MTINNPTYGLNGVRAQLIATRINPDWSLPLTLTHTHPFDLVNTITGPGGGGTYNIAGSTASGAGGSGQLPPQRRYFHQPRVHLELAMGLPPIARAWGSNDIES